MRLASALVLVLACGGCPGVRHDTPSNVLPTAEGFLAPSDLDPEVHPITTGSGADARHYFCAPTIRARWNGHLVLYLVGAREDPATAHAFAEYACGHGYAVIAPAYRNDRAIRDLCTDDADCYEAVRREIVFGADPPPAVLDVGHANTLVHRIDTILAHLAIASPAVWSPVRTTYAGGLARTIVVGFSQGTGHALILAHDREVERVILMSGPLDRVHSLTSEQGPVTWIARWARTSPKTPGTRMFAINYAADPFTQPTELDANYAALGIPGATCEVTEDKPTGECHRFVIHTDPCARPIDGHVTPSVASFGTPTAPCALGGPLRHLGPTWDYLLAPH